MSINFIESDFEKVSYLLNLLIAHATGKAAESSEYEKLRHELLSNHQVANQLPAWIKLHRNLDSFWGFIQPKFSTYAERRTYLSEQFTPLLDSLEFGAEPPTQNPKTMSNSVNTSVARNKRNVFIVHGRDNEAKYEVSRFIEALGLKAIILHEQASSGMTIIEKIEHYSNDADFALVLYTPCDHGRGAHESKMHPKNRARQNVVFEHGRRQKLSATPDLSGTVLPLCLIPNSALKSAPPFKSVVPKASACAGLPA